MFVLRSNSHNDYGICIDDKEFARMFIIVLYALGYKIK